MYYNKKQLGDILNEYTERMIISMASEFNQFKYQNEFVKNNYDRISLTMPKGKKDTIKQAATVAGMSVNEFINHCIDAKLD